MSRVFDANLNNFLQVNISRSAAQHWSMCAYIKPDDSASNMQALTLARHDTATDPRMGLGMTGGTDLARHFNQLNSTSTTTESSSAVDLDEWNLVVVTYDHTGASYTRSIYNDSATADTGTGLGGSGTLTRLTVGRFSDSTPSNPFLGNVAQCIIWENLELSSSDVTSLLNATSTAGLGAVQSGSILCHYPLDGSNLSDETGTLSDLTVNGTVASSTDEPFDTGITISVPTGPWR